MQGLVQSNLSYVQGVLKNGTELIDDHTYIILHVFKDAGYPDVLRYTNTSDAPWAKLATSQFTAAVTNVANGEEQLKALQGNFLTQLENEVTLLKSEPRFSASDRVAIVKFFAERAKNLISSQCRQVSPVLTGVHCPTNGLEQYVAAPASIPARTP